VLGICYGHQLLAHALGGEVGYHPGGLEIGTVEVTRNPHAADDVLLGALPGRFAAQVVHHQSVRALPPGAVPLAGNAHEPHHAYRIGERAWGVQFHPEFSADAMRCYIDTLAPSLSDAGRDVQALRTGVRDTPDAAALLGRFARLCSAPAG
jgi:GMP synthase (glutamine-hydrolysing)